MEKNTSIITPAGEIVGRYPARPLTNIHYVHEGVHIEIRQRARNINDYTIVPELSRSIFVFKHEGRTMHLLVRYSELPSAAEPQTSVSAKLTLHGGSPVLPYEPSNVVLGEIDNYTKSLIQTAINHVIIRFGRYLRQVPEGYLVSLLRKLPIMADHIGEVRCPEGGQR